MIQLSDHFDFGRLLRFTFPSIVMLLFPLIWRLDGIWFSIVAAELVTVAVVALFLAVNRKKYRY